MGFNEYIYKILEKLDQNLNVKNFTVPLEFYNNFYAFFNIDEKNAVVKNNLELYIKLNYSSHEINKDRIIITFEHNFNTSLSIDIIREYFQYQQTVEDTAYRMKQIILDSIKEYISTIILK